MAEAYSNFAAVYDALMDNIPYDAWADYLHGLLVEYDIASGILAELGCGTGNITERMADFGYDMIGIDNSPAMLDIANEKREQNHSSSLYLCQDMREFELYGTVAAIVSLCDSVNYITEPEELTHVFSLVNNYLDPDGLFIFDFHTEHYYRDVVAEATIAEDRDAKEAVHLEVEEYMLKPINATELSDCLKRLKDTLDREREEKLNVTRLENYFNAALPVLQNNFFVSLIEGRVTEENCGKFFAAYQIDMKGPYYGCAVFHTSEHHVPDGMNPLLLAMSVEHEIKERLATEWKSRVFSYLGNTLMLIELSSEDAIVQFTDSCDRFCKWAYRVMGAVVTAGIGRVCDNMANIKTSYDGAREAVSYRVLYGTKRAINIAELAPKEQETTLQPEDTRMHDLFKAIHLGLKEEIEKVVVNEIEKLHSNAQTVSQYNLAIMEMVGAFYRFCANNFLDFNDHLHGIQNPYETIPQMDESTLTAWMQEVSVELGEQLKNARNSTSRRLVTDAQNLVRERYMEPDLSLDTICSVLGVSNSYFSSVFKKETGKAFITYLTDYRMDHAATLILETNEKSYQIAERVGYLDANYFSYVFKKRFGVSPSKYRAQHTNQ